MLKVKHKIYSYQLFKHTALRLQLLDVRRSKIMEASTFKSQELCKNKVLLDRNALETITSRNNIPRKQCSYLARLRLEWYFSAKSV